MLSYYGQQACCRLTLETQLLEMQPGWSAPTSQSRIAIAGVGDAGLAWLQPVEAP